MIIPLTRTFGAESVGECVRKHNHYALFAIDSLTISRGAVKCLKNSTFGFMLSILIPVYQYDCRRLVDVLLRQAELLGCTCELILGDDASDTVFNNLYDKIAQANPVVRIYRASSNVGAGRMRNILAREARYPVLLLVDADVMPRDDLFLRCYLRSYRPDVVSVGGFVYDIGDVNDHNRLRYIYGTQVEQQTALDRCLNPYARFIAMAMLIPRDLMLMIGFPEEMGMGYEDAVFGCRLEEAKIPINHIDCPVVHSLKETSREFLDTTCRYVQNLHSHRAMMPQGRIRLLALYQKILWVPGLRFSLGFLWRLLRRSLEKQLEGKNPSLRLFSLYKLLYICSLSL